MTYFYSNLICFVGAVLFSTATFAHTNHQPYAQTAVSFSGATSTRPLQKPHKNDLSIKRYRGSFSADLAHWDVSPQTAVRNLGEWLGLKKPIRFEKIAEKTDDQNITHALYQGFYKGVAIESAQFVLHSKAGKATYINGHVNDLKSVSLQKSISKKRALSKAKQHFEIADLYKRYPVNLIIAQVGEKGNSSFKLLYKTKIVSISPFVMSRVYIDAQTGEIVRTINLIRSIDTPGNGKTLYKDDQDFTVDEYNDSYRLRENGDRKIETYDASHITGMSYTGQLNGAEDYIRSFTDFSGAQMDTLKIVGVSANQNDEFYIKVKDFDDEEIFTSYSFSSDQLPITLTHIDQPLYNSPVTIELWKENSAGQDDLQTSFEASFSEGNHQYNQDGITGSYTMSSIGNPALDAHWGMEVTYDFYADVFGRESYDGNNSVIKQYLNPPADVINNTLGETGLPNNAFALQDPFNIMVYGLGDDQIMAPVVGIDIEGHEFSHMVIDHNGLGGLNYQGESGALNESFADILGTCIEFYSGVDPNWTIGENVALYGNNFRSMSNPKNPGGLSQQPDTYEGDYWQNPDGYFDNGGVHTNSGVQNYWFYLVSEGGSGTNDKGDSYDVQGIGIEKAREIVYRNIMNYLFSTADYMDAYAGSLQAAKDLYGIPSAEYTSVSKAWYAVGIGDNPEEYCGGETDFTEATGTFGDGSGPDNDYVNNAHCTWLIHPEGAEHIKLTFTDFDTEEGADYVVIYDGTDDSAPVLAEYSGNSIPDEVVSNGGSMFVEFYSDQANKKSGWTANYTIDLGVDSHELDQKLTVFPNPTRGDFTVHSAIARSTQLSVYDINGKQVLKPLSIQEGDNPIKVSNLSAGIYFLKFTCGKTHHVEKLIVE